MKKSFFVAMAVSCLGLLAISCSSTNLETNQVGWSSYSDTVVKDFDAVKIVKASSTETITKGPLGLYQSTEGSRVLYSQLMDEAAKAGADDIINLRIDRKLVTSTVPGFMIFSTKKTTYTYTATALAIKYKDAVVIDPDEEESEAVAANSSSKSEGGFFKKVSGKVTGFFKNGYRKIFKKSK